jgi:exodeoxyribonuclease VII small subunit
MTKTTNDFSYQKARAELSEILDWFESGEVDIEQALAKYDRADALLKQIDTYLSDAKAKITTKIHDNS